MARPGRSAEIDASLLTDAQNHPNDVVRVVAEELGVSRAAAATRARTLISEGYLVKSGIAANLSSWQLSSRQFSLRAARPIRGSRMDT